MALRKKTTKVSAKKKTPKLNEKDMEILAEEYSRISEQIKELSERKKELSTQIKDGAKDGGVIDDKGSYYFSTEHYVCGCIHNVKLTPDVERGYKFLSAYKCKDGSNLKNCIKQVTTYDIDESELANAVNKGLIDISVVRENVFNKTESYSVSVKPRETEAEMPEVIQTTVSKPAKRAARKK